MKSLIAKCGNSIECLKAIKKDFRLLPSSIYIIDAYIQFLEQLELIEQEKKQADIFITYQAKLSK